MITMGPCSRSTCSCAAASFVGSPTDQSRCVECDHLLSEHQDYAYPPSHPPPTPSFSLSRLSHTDLTPNISRRSSLVKKLVTLVYEVAVVHVRGTPASGKTILATLLREALESQYHAVIMLGSWSCPSNLDAKQYLMQCCRQASISINGGSLVCTDVVIIIDEAQSSYGDMTLWNALIKNCSLRQAPGLRFCLFSSYGSPKHGTSTYDPRLTPPILNPQQRVSLLPRQEWMAPDFGLFYTEAECTEVIHLTTSYDPTTEATFSDDASLKIFSLTNGHPGMVSSFIRFMFQYYRSELKSGLIQFSLSHVSSAFSDREHLMMHLSADLCGRGLPVKGDDKRLDDPGVVNALRNVLIHQSIPFQPDSDPGLKICFEQGWIQVERGQGLYVPQTCFFPTHIHAIFVEHAFCTFSPKAFPIDRYPSPQELFLAVLRKFSPTIIREAAKGARSGPSGIPRPKEAAFQDEFYRSYADVLDFAGGLGSEWTCGKGAIDFFVPQQKWGFELLRNGDRLDEHLARFRRDGRYYPAIQTCLMVDWLILDFRTDTPSDTYPDEPKLLRVVFTPDYDLVLVLDNKNRPLGPQIAL